MLPTQPSLFGEPEWVAGFRCDHCHARAEVRRRPRQPFEDDWRCRCGATGLLSHSRTFGERAEEESKRKRDAHAAEQEARRDNDR